jgi:tetratricopeptide (TPR) repeat protein
MGESYDLQGKPKGAIQEFRKAIALAPAMPRLHFGLGFVLWEEQEFEEARREFSDELRINQHFSPAAYYLGDISLSQNDLDKAAFFFQRAIAENPECLVAHVGLGKTFSRAGEMRKAVEQFERANQIDPNQADVHYLLATTYRRLGDMHRAAEELKRYETSTSKNKFPLGPGGRQGEGLTITACMPRVR